MAQEILLRILAYDLALLHSRISGSSSMNYFWVQTEHLEKGYRLANISVEYKKNTQPSPTASTAETHVVWALKLEPGLGPNSHISYT